MSANEKLGLRFPHCSTRVGRFLTSAIVVLGAREEVNSCTDIFLKGEYTRKRRIVADQCLKVPQIGMRRVTLPLTGFSESSVSLSESVDDSESEVSVGESCTGSSRSFRSGTALLWFCDGENTVRSTYLICLVAGI